MFSLGLVLWVIVTTSVVGDRMLSHCALEWTNRVQRFVFAAAMGLGVWLLAIFWAGWTLGYFRETALVVMTLFTVPTVFYARGSFENGAAASAGGRSGWLASALASLCAVSVAALILAGFAPVVNFADALTYHLNLPKEFLRLGRIQALPYDANSMFPLLLDIGFGFGLMFQNATFANLLAAWMGILCAAGIYGWARERGAPAHAWLGTAAFLLTPAVYNHFPVPYVDIGLALFALLMFWSFCSWVRMGRRAWIVLSGFFCGLALGVKYFALIYAVLVLAAIVVEGWRRKTGALKIAELLWIFVFVAGMTGAIWYVRSWWVMGNPVYPYASAIFSGKPTLLDWQLVERTYGVGYSPRHLLTLFWDATFRPLAYAGFGTRWNLLFLGLLPLVVWHVGRRKGGWLAILAGAMLLSWFGISQVMRFLIPFFPLYCVLIAWAAVEMDAFGRPLRCMIWAWVLAICLWETACVVAHAKPQIALLGNSQKTRTYLLQKEPTYAMADYVNAVLPSTARILSVGEIRFFYFKPFMVREEIFRHFEDYPAMHASAAAVTRYLKKQGFTHVLVAGRGGASPSRKALPALAVANIVHDPALFKLLGSRQSNVAGERTHYCLYAIR